ncbi:MAG: hypothetical protein KGL67_01685 [Patescibacteria group bacterium]|nr:hypothetical protein [Patescibacteria group bacterium]
MIEKPRNSKEVIRNFTKENNITTESVATEDVLRLYLKGGWSAYNLNKIAEAKDFCVQIQKLIKQNKRQVNKEEQEFINAIKKITRKENED